ncbi:paraneoplastic antigen Ma1 homolog [Xenopus laevis]|uniref:Paraneoplastic antigen Ma1 homolog n=1 Tax=Xenopus laevis TaxID=8355 RepID=A0A8J1KTH6_XENLA|nr:paraneoplastic antigen Ma1 homolog [Xenopus laevis]
MEPQALLEWCQDRQANPTYCLALIIAEANLNSRQIYQLMDEMSPFGRCLIVDRKTDNKDVKTCVLLQMEDPINPDDVPFMMTFGSEKYQCNLVLPASPVSVITSDGDVEHPAAGNKEVNNPSLAANPCGPSAAIGADILTALGNLVEKCVRPIQPHSGFGYRKLHFFSGKQPTPEGEDDFEAWMDQATQALEEWDVPESQKKQRITESLMGPAADVIRALKQSKRDCCATDYLQALHDVYGRTENVAELMYQFEHTYQEKDESMSDYIPRLEKILHHIILKKGMDPYMADQLRVKQILKGAQPNDPIMWKLRIPKEDRAVPTYPQLIKQVREEEALMEAKLLPTSKSMTSNKVKPGGEAIRIVQASTGVIAPEQSEIHNRLDALSEMVERIAKIQLAALEKDTKCRSDIVCCEKPTSSQAQDFHLTYENTPAPGPPQLNRTKGVLGFCHLCGEDGHYKRQCRNAENAQKVVAKLLAKERGKAQGNFRGPQ